MVQKLKTHGKTLIGLTGVFGSGKSTVAHWLEELGACVIDADRMAHEALRKESPVFNQVRVLFKESHLQPDQDIDRKKIAEIVFRDDAKRKALEQIVHPYVIKRIMEEVAAAKESVVVLEIPLLFEAGFEKLCDFTITVASDPEKMEERLLQKGFSPEEIRRRWKAQWPLEEKIKRSDCVIQNSGTLKETRRDAEKIWNRFCARFEKGEQSSTWQEKK